MNCIFIDVDGVLNCEPYCRKHNEEIGDIYVERLKKIVDATNAEIIVSSTWKRISGCKTELEDEMWNYLCNKLAVYGLKIKDVTPDLESGHRPSEILTWLKKYNVSGFVCLDDDYTKKDYDSVGLGEHLVKTEYWCFSENEGGIQEHHIKEAIQKMGIGGNEFVR